jgi:hypothetical protein
MSELGDLLELVDGAELRTVRATIRTWRHHERGRRAYRAHAERAGAVVGSYGPGVTEETHEDVIRLWLAPPGRAREEHEAGHVGVRDGARWWMYHPQAGATSNGGDPSVRAGVAEAYEPLFAPGPLLGALR